MSNKLFKFIKLSNHILYMYMEWKSGAVLTFINYGIGKDKRPSDNFIDMIYYNGD